MADAGGGDRSQQSLQSQQSNSERQPKNYFLKFNFQKLIPRLKANLLNSSVEFWSVRPQSDSSKKVLNSFKEVGLAKSEKKIHLYFFEDPKCYIFLVD